MRRSYRVSWPGVFLVVIIALAFSFLWVAYDYSDEALAGTYFYRSGNVVYKLGVDRDFGFHEVISSPNGRVVSAVGTWRRLGESGVVFSKGFAPLPNQVLRNSGEADGYFHRKWNILMELNLEGAPTSLIRR